MNCTVCSNPFVLGTDKHAHCRAQQLEAQAQAETQVGIIEDLLESVSNLTLAAQYLSIRVSALEEKVEAREATVQFAQHRISELESNLESFEVVQQRILARPDPHTRYG